MIVYWLTKKIRLATAVLTLDAINEAEENYIGNECSFHLIPNKDK